ncbi:MAG: transcriptional regulator [Candidatus Hecatellaceae archaeon]
MGEVPLSPVGKEEIHRLESALLVGTLFRPEVLAELRDPTERLTWVDSLAVAAAALAREKAKMPVSRIADELGRSEATIRNHLTGKTKAGQLVRETYERFLREGVKIELTAPGEEAEKLREELEKVKAERQQLQEKLQKVREALSQLMGELS